MKYILLLTIPLYLLDQLTKALVVKHIPLDYGRIEITSFFNLTHIRNEGVAFGMANGSAWANVVFGAVSFTALIVISTLWHKGAFHGVIAKLAAALLISGILGNLTDRLARGSVVDFLDFHWGAGHFPPWGQRHFLEWGPGHFANFNVADSCICIAAGLIFITAFLPEKPETVEAETGVDSDGSP